MKISDGLDGSGSHRIFNQVNVYPDLSTKIFNLLGFKVLTITDTNGSNLYCNKFPNSPFSLRPVDLTALKEDYGNVKFIMKTLINPKTERIMENGCILGGHISVKIIRSLFDTKMAGLLDDVGGASCHLCTATDSQIKSLEWVESVFPINRFTTDAQAIFNEVSEEEFVKLTAPLRGGITHQPTSDINFIAVSLLHAYICVFRWFMLLIYCLDAGHRVWSPSNSKVQVFMRRIR